MKKHTLTALILSTLMASASFANTEQTTPIVVTGDMPLWKAWVTMEWISEAELETLCPGGTNPLELGKCMQRELDGAENGDAFIKSAGNFGRATLTVDEDKKKDRRVLKMVAKFAAAAAIPTITYMMTPKVSQVEGDNPNFHTPEYQWQNRTYVYDLNGNEIYQDMNTGKIYKSDPMGRNMGLALLGGSLPMAIWGGLDANSLDRYGTQKTVTIRRYRFEGFRTAMAEWKLEDRSGVPVFKGRDVMGKDLVLIVNPR